ncbi:MAG: ParB/RepB/Spo0J family partition protein [Candidatus Hodarchaeota archaeon]
MKLEMINADMIRPAPWQPRDTFPKEGIDELAKSIDGMGLIQPIVVRKKGKTFEITAGERRWRAFDQTGFDKIPCVVRDEDDTDAKVTSLIENWQRAAVDSPQNEKFMAELYKEGTQKGKWKTISDMSKKTGIPRQTLDGVIYAYDKREELSAGRKITYRDIEKTKPLEDTPDDQKKLLKLREKEKIKSTELRETAIKIKDMPKPVRDAVLDEEIEYKEVEKRMDVGIPEELATPLVQELKKEKKIKEDYEKGELEADKAVLKGEIEAKEWKIDKSADEKRFKKYEELWKQFKFLSPAHINMIETPRLRNQAIQYIKDIRDFCDNLLSKLGG